MRVPNQRILLQPGVDVQDNVVIQGVLQVHMESVCKVGYVAHNGDLAVLSEVSWDGNMERNSWVGQSYSVVVVVALKSK